MLERLLPRGFEFHLVQVTWSYDLAYRTFTPPPDLRELPTAADLVLELARSRPEQARRVSRRAAAASV